MRTDAVSLNAERFTGQGTSFVQLFPLTVPDTLSRRVPRQAMKRADLLMIFRLPMALTGAIASWPLFILPFHETSTFDPRLLEIAVGPSLLNTINYRTTFIYRVGAALGPTIGPATRHIAEQEDDKEILIYSVCQALRMSEQ